MKASPKKSGLTKSNATAIKQMVAVVLLLNLSVISMACLSLYKSRQQFTKQASVAAQNLSHVLERYLNGTLGMVETGLLTVAAEAENHIVKGTIDVQSLAPHIKRHQIDFPDLAEYRIINARGDYIYTAGVIPKTVSTADQDYFIQLRNNPNLKTSIFIPQISRINGKWIIVIAKRINQPDGSFAGVVAVPFSIDKIYQIFSTIDVGEHGSIILRDGGLKIAVRYPELKNIGRIDGSKATVELQGLVQKGLTEGKYKARAPIDKIERDYSFRKVSGQPFYIIVGLSALDYLSEWRKEVVHTAALIALFCLVTTISALLFYREWKRRNSAINDLAQQEAKYQTIADYTYAWEFWISPDGSLIYSSPSCKRVTGYDAGAFCSDPDFFHRIIHPDDQQLYTEHRQEKTQKVAHHLILRICHADGTVRWLEHECQPVYDQTGTFLGNRGSNRDVTDRIRMETALAQSEEHFHQLFIQNWDAVVLLHQETLNIVDANPAMLSLIGYELEELQTAGAWPAIAPETTLQFQQLFNDTVLLGEAFLEKGTCLCKDGTKIFISAKTKLIRLREQNVIYCSIRDISDRIKLEQEQVYVQSKLIHANKMTSLGMLVSGIAHEINNPNQYISLNAAILADVWKDSSTILSNYHEQHGEFTLKGMTFKKALETVPRLITGVTEGSKRIDLIVKNLKDYSRDNSGQPQADFDLNQIIQTAVQILTPYIHKHTYNFQTELNENIPRVRVNAQQIEQVTINLITNALQALTGKTQVVRVATLYEQETDSVVLSVHDGGKGMTREVMERIMEPFFSTRLDAGGTGLGLSISSTLLKENGGTIEFKSTPDSGTIATIKLKAAEGKGSET